MVSYIHAHRNRFYSFPEESERKEVPFMGNSWRANCTKYTMRATSLLFRNRTHPSYSRGYVYGTRCNGWLSTALNVLRLLPIKYSHLYRLYPSGLALSLDFLWWPASIDQGWHCWHEVIGLLKWETSWKATSCILLQRQIYICNSNYQILNVDTSLVGWRISSSSCW